MAIPTRRNRTPGDRFIAKLLFSTDFERAREIATGQTPPGIEMVPSPDLLAGKKARPYRDGLRDWELTTG
jgi:hypothetical protein